MRSTPKSTRKLAHGTKCWCGSCGSPCTWDDMQRGKDGLAVFEDSAWYNSHEGHLECHNCYDR